MSRNDAAGLAIVTLLSILTPREVSDHLLISVLTVPLVLVELVKYALEGLYVKLTIDVL